jgi:periplasmic divalent cation tolerance protein
LNSICQIHFTIDDEDAATALVETLLEEHLIACAHHFQPVTSRYRWEGRLETATEWLVTMKTQSALIETVIGRVKELHSYDTPEILVTPVVGGNESYIAWVVEETGGAS